MQLKLKKGRNGLSSIIINNVFQFGKNCTDELRSGNHLYRTNIQTVYFRRGSIKTKYLRQTLVFTRNSALQEKLNFCFSKYFY